MVGQANEKPQIGGNHYRVNGTELQHWDVVRIFNLGYLIGNATKYLFRWREKGGIEDMKKAIHYIEKQIEESTPPDPYAMSPAPKTANQQDGVTVFWGFGTDGRPWRVWIDDREYVSLSDIPRQDLITELSRRDQELEQQNMAEHARSLSDGEDGPHSCTCPRTDCPVHGDLRY